MESPNKQGFHDFSKLIDETEASMRDKLSELTMPDHGDNEVITVMDTANVTPVNEQCKTNIAGESVQNSQSLRDKDVTAECSETVSTGVSNPDIADIPSVPESNSIKSIIDDHSVPGSIDQAVQDDPSVPGPTSNQGVLCSSSVPESTTTQVDTDNPSVSGSTSNQGVTDDQGVPGSTSNQGVTDDQGVPWSTSNQGVTDDQGVPESTSNQGVTDDQGVPESTTVYAVELGISGSNSNQVVADDAIVPGPTSNQAVADVIVSELTSNQGVTDIASVPESTSNQGVTDELNVLESTSNQGVTDDLNVLESTSNQGVTDIASVPESTSNQGVTDDLNVPDSTSNQSVTDIASVPESTSNQGVTDDLNVPESTSNHGYTEDASVPVSNSSKGVTDVASVPESICNPAVTDDASVPGFTSNLSDKYENCTEQAVRGSIWQLNREAHSGDKHSVDFEESAVNLADNQKNKNLIVEDSYAYETIDKNKGADDQSEMHTTVRRDNQVETEENKCDNDGVADAMESEEASHDMSEISSKLSTRKDGTEVCTVSDVTETLIGITDDNGGEAGNGEKDDESFMITDVRSLTEDNRNDCISKGIGSSVVEEHDGSHPKHVSDVVNNPSETSGMDTRSIVHAPSEECDKGIETMTCEPCVIEMEKSVVSNSQNERNPSLNTVRSDTDETVPVETVSNDPTVLVTSGNITQTISGNSSGSVETSTASISPEDAGSLPIICNTFSIKDLPTSVTLVKNEPAEDRAYGLMQNCDSTPALEMNKSTRTSCGPAISLVTGNATIHKGRIVSQVSPGTSTQKLVMSKVPPMICRAGPINSTPATLTRYPRSSAIAHTVPRVQTIPRTKVSVAVSVAPVIYRNLVPRGTVCTVPAAITSSTVTSKTSNMQITTVAAASSKDQSKNKAKDIAQSKKLSMINIHSVGVSRITDLIARKNPIPTYKPEPIPEALKARVNMQTYPCYECGDSFHFENSLKQHLGRCSLKIFFKCEKCVTTIVFTNKCQLLNHLRSHLNIEKTQAVPIHIKSDSIEIKTNFDDIVPGKMFEWYNMLCSNQMVLPRNDSPPVSNRECLECGKMCTDTHALAEHYKGISSDHFFCTKCPLYMNTTCALQAHFKLHKLADINVNRSLTNAEWKILKSLSCPECGKHFWEGGIVTVNIFLNTMVLHLKNTCLHMSRLPAFKCSKCSVVCQSFDGIRNHFNTCLEHYYKCGLCPMALKSVKSLETHFAQKHKTEGNIDETVVLKAKIIYRCHVCDTLIDDKSFLVQHVDKHMAECQSNPMTHYHCLQCGQILLEKKALTEHSSKHQTVKRQLYCTFCSHDKVWPIPYLTHMLNSHTASTVHLAGKNVVRFCEYCGLVCVGEQMFRRHACLATRNAPTVIGDKTERLENKSKSRTAELRPIKLLKDGYSEEMDIFKNDIPTHLSKKCLSCSQPFTSLSNRLSHLKEHRDIDKVFICKTCDSMKYKSYHELRSHEIACTALSNAHMDLSTLHTNMSEKKSELTPNKRFKMIGENKCEKRMFSDGVELTPKELTGRGKRKCEEVVEYFICDKCDAMFTRKSKREEHVKSEHGIHPCHLCGLMHESQSSLKKHLMLEHEGKRMFYYCGICKSRKIDKPFSQKSKLEKHFHVKHRMKVIDESKVITQLPGLPESSKESTIEMQKHNYTESTSPETKKLRIEGESFFKCAKCLFTCEIKSEFREHILEHKAADTYQCFECGLCFAVLPSLRKHVFMVHKVRDFETYMEENKIEEPAAIEDNENEDEWELNADIGSSDEENGDNSLECKVCYIVFDNEKALKTHMRTHGMAFIKKSRKRAHAISPGKNLEKATQNDGGRRETLVLKIKRSRIEPVDVDTVESVHISTERSLNTEAIDTSTEVTEPIDKTTELANTDAESVQNTIPVNMMNTDAEPSNTITEHMTESLPTMTDSQPSEPMEIDSPPTMIDSQPTLIDSQPTLIDSQPTLIDSPPTPIDSQPTLIDSQPTLIESPPAMIDSQPTLIDSQPTPIDSQPTKIDSQPTKIDSQPTKIDSQPTLIDSQPTPIDSQPTPIDSQPTLIDSQPTLIDSPPAMIDSQPTLIDSQPTLIDSQPTLIDSQPTPIDSQPTLIDSQPTLIDSQPTLIDSQPTKIDSQSTLNESQQTQIESPPAMIDSQQTMIDSQPTLIDSQQTDLFTTSTD